MTTEPHNDVNHFVEDMGLFFEQAGLSRMAGRVMGRLLISDPSHQTMHDLVENLHASKASISHATRLLIQIGFVDRVSFPGNRRDHYRIRPGAWVELTRRRAAHITAFRELAERGLGLVKDQPPQKKAALHEMHDIYAFFEREFPPLLERWEQSRQSEAGTQSAK